MKVKDLIEQLKTFDQELEVWAQTCCDFNPAQSASEDNIEDQDKRIVTITAKVRHD